MILVVDDDPEVLKLVRVNLELEGFRVTWAADGYRALEMLRGERPAVVLLDVMMPGMGGFEVCQQIRGFSDIPIVMLTAMGDESDITRGLNLGADDYVSKPFNSQELAARIKAVMRRTRRNGEPAPAVVATGGLVIDVSQNMVRMGTREVPLPRTECRLLCMLARHSGRVMTYEHLLTEVWGDEYSRYDIRALEAAISRLRRKLSDGGCTHNYIVSKKGVGYFFNAPDRQPPDHAAGWPVTRQASG